MNRKIGAIDSLRGIAVVLVLLAHLAPYIPIKSLWLGNFGVTGFFLLSSFLLHYINISKGFSPLAYAIKRGAKILPPLAVLVVSVSMIAFVTQLLMEALDLAKVGELISLMTPHLWSICVELLWYLILPGFAILQPQLRLRIIAASILPLSLFQSGWTSLPTHLASFLLGLLVAELLHRRGWLLSSSRAIRVAKISIITIVVVFVSLVEIFGLDSTTVIAWLPLANLIWLLGLSLAISQHRDVAILSWIGKTSYGIYLWHYPVFFFIPSLSMQLGAPWAITLAVSVSITLGWLNHKLIETYFLGRAASFLGRPSS